jgi:hypothetical protein
MQLYDSQDDMEKKEYRPAKDARSMQAAWALILDPRPLVHELGSISLETVRKALYKLYAHNFEAPEGFTLGRDVLLLSVIIGEARQDKTKVLSEVLTLLGVFEGAGAYYVVIDTGLDRPTLHAGAYIEDGLLTSLTIAALVREQAALEQAALEQSPLEQAPLEQAPLEQAPLEQGLSKVDQLALRGYKRAIIRLAGVYEEIEYPGGYLDYQEYVEHAEHLGMKPQAPHQHYRSLSEEDRLKIEGYQRHIELLEKKLDKQRCERDKKLLDETWALVLAKIEKQGFADNNNIKHLSHIVEETLELANVCEDDYMIEVWESRSQALAKLVQLRENGGQA